MAGFGLISTQPVTGQIYKTHHSFTGYGPSLTNGGGATPRAKLVLSGNILYGAAAGGGGGGAGTLFKINTDGTGFTNLHTFTAINGRYANTDGASPSAGLILSGNTLYGTAAFGGASGNGTVFALNTDGTGFSTLYSFSSESNFTNTDGAHPAGSLVLSGSSLYGTATKGGSAGYGTVFALNTDGTGFTVLHSFSTNLNDINPDGYSPWGGLVLSGNTLYGTAESGGTSGYGTVFALNIDGTGFTTLHHFTGSYGPLSTNRDGANPQAGLLLVGNTLFGTASDGGNRNSGTVFSLNTDGTAFTNLYRFPPGVFGGAFPRSELVLSGNTLYGTASYGSTSYGTVFAVNTDGTAFRNLHSFTATISSSEINSDGANPDAGLILSGATLYGTATRGGRSGVGTVFAVNTDGAGFTNLHNFAAISGYTIGINSDGGTGSLRAKVTESNGTLYGTATEGGGAGYGTVFAVNTDGTGFTNLHSFTAIPGPLYTNSDGANPYAGLILSGTTLYGTAASGGSSSKGTVFAVNIDGSGFTTLHSFSATSGSSATNSATNSEGANPWAELVLSGNTIYGAALLGGNSGVGTVFSLRTDGTAFSNLRSFLRISDGAYPGALLLSDNTLYGTARSGGSFEAGTVFALNTDGTGFTNLYTFTNSDGNGPRDLILSGHTLYGTVMYGGSSGGGSVFALNTDGTGFTILHKFNGVSDFPSTNIGGASPQGGLSLIGNTLYGTTGSGGSLGLEAVS